MKIAVSGKGGVGKTTLAGMMARMLADQGHRVITVDADPDSNLASALGIAEEEADGITPLAQMQEFIEERTGTKKGQYGSFFQINPRVDDIPERFSLKKNGVRLIMLGSIPRGGGGCFCPENVLLKSLITHLLIERNDYVIVDMEAGLEHLGRGTTEYIDALIVVVEPGKRSCQTAYQVRKLAGDIGVRRVYIVANKVTGDGDIQYIKRNLPGFVLLGTMSYNDAIIEADKHGLSPYGTDQKIKDEVLRIIEALRNEINLAGTGN